MMALTSSREAMSRSSAKSITSCPTRALASAMVSPCAHAYSGAAMCPRVIIDGHFGPRLAFLATRGNQSARSDFRPLGEASSSRISARGLTASAGGSNGMARSVHPRVYGYASKVTLTPSA